MKVKENRDYEIYTKITTRNSYRRSFRYYIYAVRFGMDDLSDVNELANKYPEARSMINRKQKNDMERK